MYVPCSRSPSSPHGVDRSPQNAAYTQIESGSTQQAGDKCEAITQLPSDMGGSSSASVFYQISEMLQKVEELTYNIPTTAVRMSSISGLFPDGHGPSAEAVEEQTKKETIFINNLRLSLLTMQSDLVEYSSNQDAMCMEHEREAATIEQEIQKQDVDAGTAPRKVYSSNDTNLGQSGADAEVMNFHYML